MAKTLPFHGSNVGSIPIRCINRALTRSELQPALQRYVTLEIALEFIFKGFTVILYVRKPKYKGLVFKVKTYGGLDSWNTR